MDECVVGREGDAGDGRGGGRRVLIEGDDGSLVAVLKEVEAGLGEAVDGLAVVVDGDVNEDEVGAGVEDGLRVGGWLGGAEGGGEENEEGGEG